MANERPITIKTKYDPDLSVKVVRTRIAHQDIFTDETIPKGSTAYKLGIRIGRKLYPGYVTEATYEQLEDE